jgi:two-component system KDP operon response regulator KdpE
VTHPQAILIVEDDVPLRTMWRTALRLEGFDVVEAGDGIEALRLIEVSPPDLVLLDLGLPHVDGISVRQDIAAQVFSRNIPIVVVTGSTQDLSYLDVNCVLRKPVTVDQIVASCTAVFNPISVDSLVATVRCPHTVQLTAPISFEAGS